MNKLTIRVEETSPNFIVLQVLEQNFGLNIYNGRHRIKDGLGRLKYSVNIEHFEKVTIYGKNLYLPYVYNRKRTFLKKADARYLKEDFSYQEYKVLKKFFKDKNIQFKLVTNLFNTTKPLDYGF